MFLVGYLKSILYALVSKQSNLSLEYTKQVFIPRRSGLSLYCAIAYLSGSIFSINLSSMFLFSTSHKPSKSGPYSILSFSSLYFIDLIILDRFSTLISRTSFVHPFSGVNSKSVAISFFSISKRFPTFQKAILIFFSSITRAICFLF